MKLFTLFIEVLTVIPASSPRHSRNLTSPRHFREGCRRGNDAERFIIIKSFIHF
jgi:hypothetical protein